MDPLDRVVDGLRRKLGETGLARLEPGLRRLAASTRLGRAPEPDAIGRLPSGIPDLDRVLCGGYPRGALAELSGPLGAGLTSLVATAAAAATRAGGLVAWIDPGFSFDPVSASLDGALLERILWIRPAHARQALEVADLLLEGGGFELVALDLALEAPGTGPRRPAPIPVSVWPRLASRLEGRTTALLVTTPTPLAGPQAALTLELAPGPCRLRPRSTLLETRTTRVRVVRHRGGSPGATLDLTLPVRFLPAPDEAASP